MFVLSIPLQIVNLIIKAKMTNFRLEDASFNIILKESQHIILLPCPGVCSRGPNPRQLVNSSRCFYLAGLKAKGMHNCSETSDKILKPDSIADINSVTQALKDYLIDGIWIDYNYVSGSFSD